MVEIQVHLPKSDYMIHLLLKSALIALKPWYNLIFSGSFPHHHIILHPFCPRHALILNLFHHIWRKSNLCGVGKLLEGCVGWLGEGGGGLLLRGEVKQAGLLLWLNSWL